MDFLQPIFFHAELWLLGCSHCGALLTLVVLLLPAGTVDRLVSEKVYTSYIMSYTAFINKNPGFMYSFSDLYSHHQFKTFIFGMADVKEVDFV